MQPLQVFDALNGSFFNGLNAGADVFARRMTEAAATRNANAMVAAFNERVVWSNTRYSEQVAKTEYWGKKYNNLRDSYNSLELEYAELQEKLRKAKSKMSKLKRRLQELCPADPLV